MEAQKAQEQLERLLIHKEKERERGRERERKAKREEGLQLL